MTETHLNAIHATDDGSMDEHSMPGELGWEGYVHLSKEIPLWKRVLDTWPELRTGLSYSLIFASGVFLGGAIMAIMSTSKNNQNIHHD